MDGDTRAIVVLLIILFGLLYGIYQFISYIKSYNSEYFANLPTYDIATYLAVREAYDLFYESTGKQVCRVSGSGEPLCSAYGGVQGPAYVYSPPLLEGRIPGSGSLVQSQAAPLTDAYFTNAGLTIDDVVLDYATFTYYRAQPLRYSFKLTDEYSMKTPMERWIDENVRLAKITGATGAIEYTCYLRIDGRNYRLVKVLGVAEDTLSCSQLNPVSKRPNLIYLGCGPKAGSQYVQLGSAPSAVVFTALLTAENQSALAGLLPATGSVGTAAAAPGATAGGDSADLLNLPKIRYEENPWTKNADLFKQMYKAIPSPSREMTAFYNSANVGNMSDTYITTLRKFIELDKRILRNATEGGVVIPSKLRTSGGAVYKFQIPYAYNPELQLLGGNYEEAASPAKYLKCYDLQAEEAAVLRYFNVERKYSDLGVTNKDIVAKVRAAICASAGYYVEAGTGILNGVDACKCTGCCIPVNYKPRDGSAPVAKKLAGLQPDSAEILGKVDNCVHMSRSFKINRTGPVIQKTPTCGAEEFVNLPENYGLAAGGMELRDKIATAKGERFFGGAQTFFA